MSKIARLPNVQAVLTVPRHTIDNTNTVPYLGADTTWGQTGRTGKGVKIAIIDTGINYYHLDFGGAGNAAWKADDPTMREPGTFPTAKVVGGYDLVGDDYNADTQPVPASRPRSARLQGQGLRDRPARDPCRGHRGRYRRDHRRARRYTGLVRQQHPRPGPTSGSGPAWRPRPSCWPIASSAARAPRIVLVDAIERAVQDGADVINMSLGSPFGDAGSLDAVASDNASLAGVVVVASSGNEGASAYMTGSPGVPRRAPSRWPRWMPWRTSRAQRLDMATGPDIEAINANDARCP